VQVARAARVQAAFERERARVAAAGKQATPAQLKLLEAQVEPHFLYNTLANVVSRAYAHRQVAPGTRFR
jgi:sensor histidine kinase YesM